MAGLLEPARSWVIWLIGVVTAFITSFYMFRLWFMTFFGDYRGAHVDEHGHSTQNDHGHGEPHESPMVMLVPLVILAILSVVGGWLESATASKIFWRRCLDAGAATEGAGEAASRGTELMLMGISVAVALLGLVLAYVLYISKPYFPQNRRFPQRLLYRGRAQILHRRTLRQTFRETSDRWLDQHPVARR